MREDLTKKAIAVLRNYLADLDYWCAAYTLDDVNSVTGGREFSSFEEVEAYRDELKTMLKEIDNA